MPPQRLPEFVALMEKPHLKATTSAVLMPQKTSLNSGDCWRSAILSIASLHRSIPMISIVRGSYLPRTCLKNPQAPRNMQLIIQEMILGRKRGVILIPDCEDDAVDVIAGLFKQGFQDLASEYRDFIIGHLVKAKA